jgi:hypothetical protein
VLESEQIRRAINDWLSKKGVNVKTQGERAGTRMNRAAYRITGGKAELLDTLMAILDPVEIDIVVMRSVADLMEAVHEQRQLDSSQEDDSIE